MEIKNGVVHFDYLIDVSDGSESIKFELGAQSVTQNNASGNFRSESVMEFADRFKRLVSDSTKAIKI